jgi:tripartite-type tricarboxylate transporter receptor subunit TctC
VHVPYKGSAPMVNDLLGGHIDTAFDNTPNVLPQVNGDKLRALGVSSKTRPALAANVPTVSEAGVPGYAAEAWYGLYAPAKTPPEIIDRLNKSAAKAVQSEAFRKLEVNEGLVMVAEPPATLERYFSVEEARWRTVIQDAGIKIE